MNWLERYVSAVKNALPASLREDVGEELHTLLEEKIVEAEERQGQPILEEEVLAILREHGHPLRVAAAYRERRVLIGEALYPFYTAALKWLALVIFFLYVAHVVISQLLSGVSDRDVVPELLGLYLVAFACVTLIFHFADRWIEGIERFERWDPRTLAPLSHGVAIVGPVVALVAVAAWMTFLASFGFERSWEILSGHGGARIQTFVMWLQVHGLFTMLLYGWLLLQPWWDVEKIAARGAIGMFLVAGAMRCAELDAATDFLVFGDRYMVSAIVTRIFWLVAAAGLIETGFCLFRVVRALRTRRTAAITVRS